MKLQALYDQNAVARELTPVPLLMAFLFGIVPQHLVVAAGDVKGVSRIGAHV